MLLRQQQKSRRPSRVAASIRREDLELLFLDMIDAVASLGFCGLYCETRASLQWSIEIRLSAWPHADIGIMQSIFSPAARRKILRGEHECWSPRRWAKNGLD